MSTTLTPREREVMVLAWRSFKNPVQIDYDKLAELAKYKNAATATACYSAAKKKMLSGEDTKITSKERELLSLSWHCFKSSPSVDFIKLAQLAKYKNAATAAACFSPIKKKFLSSSGGTDGIASLPKAPNTSNVSRKRKKKAAAEYLADGDATEASVDDFFPPTKKKAKQEAKEVVKIKEDPEETADESVTDLIASAAKFLEDEAENEEPATPEPL